MPTAPQDARTRSPWIVAVGTGAATALLAMAAAVAVVAACWLPVSGGAGNAGSVIRAGVLTFLAALHAGITIDGLPTAFIPLGMTLAVAALAWRAGRSLAAVVQDEQRPARLCGLAGAQIAAFAAVSGVAAPLATLGTTSVPAVPAALAACVLFAVSGGLAFVRSSALAQLLVLRRLALAVPAVRAAAAALAVEVAAASLLVAGALVVHHDRVVAISHQVGGGWSGLPVLLLGLLAAPNAVIAGSSYLAGPGFALGSGSHVSLFSTTHGTLPAFPLLGATPTGHGANAVVWTLAGATPVLAGALVALSLRHSGSLLARLRDSGAAAVIVGLTWTVLAWQGGGAVGSGRLNAVGASPWQAGLATAGALALATCLATGVLAAVRAWRSHRARSDEARSDEPVDEPAAVVQLVATPAAEPAADTPGADELAG